MNINVKNTTFKHSHLLASTIYVIHTFDIGDSIIYNQLKDDYNLVRETIINHGFQASTGKIGGVIQPQTKGSGYGSTSRAFYARVPFLKQIIQL